MNELLIISVQHQHLERN